MRSLMIDMNLQPRPFRYILAIRVNVQDHHKWRLRHHYLNTSLKLNNWKPLEIRPYWRGLNASPVRPLISGTQYHVIGNR